MTDFADLLNEEFANEGTDLLNSIISKQTIARNEIPQHINTIADWFGKRRARVKLYDEVIHTLHSYIRQYFYEVYCKETEISNKLGEVYKELELLSEFDKKEYIHKGYIKEYIIAETLPYYDISRNDIIFKHINWDGFVAEATREFYCELGSYYYDRY